MSPIDECSIALARAERSFYLLTPAQRAQLRPEIAALRAALDEAIRNKVVPTPVPEGSVLGVDAGDFDGTTYVVRRDASGSELYLVARMHQMNGAPEDRAAVRLLAQKFAASEAMERVLSKLAYTCPTCFDHCCTIPLHVEVLAALALARGES